MAWRGQGDKPLSEPTMESLLTHNASLGLNKLTEHDVTAILEHTATG